MASRELELVRRMEKEAWENYVTYLNCMKWATKGF